ncbi:hypothetical protein D5086_002648 [Populus alba]|uniref:Uncharacterized protein n=1 Tax=Populus alba TaxID=43335 RepID=A0ACC4D3C4_POPAL
MGLTIAKAREHHVTVLSSSDKKREEALEHLGADEYLVSSDGEDMQKAADSLDFCYTYGYAWEKVNHWELHREHEGNRGDA